MTAHASNWKNLWGGIMLDEEPTWETVSDFETLNAYTAQKLSAIAGIAWWYNEIGLSYNSVTFTQSQYNALMHGCTPTGSYCGYSWDAPQVYNSNFAAAANALGDNYLLVTWWTGSSSPWNTMLYAEGHTSGTPYDEKFGTSNTFCWSNQFQA